MVRNKNKYHEVNAIRVADICFSEITTTVPWRSRSQKISASTFSETESHDSFPII
jgi:hypothetical protein